MVEEDNMNLATTGTTVTSNPKQRFATFSNENTTNVVQVELVGGDKSVNLTNITTTGHE